MSRAHQTLLHLRTSEPSTSHLSLDDIDAESLLPGSELKTKVV